MRVLLVWPKARTDPEWGGDLGAVAEPLALEYLAAVARADGHEVRILDLRLHPGTLATTIAEFPPDVVGVTAFSMHVHAAIDACVEVKRVAPSCRTVAGGHHATFLPEDFFVPAVDHVVVGEGTLPFAALLRAVADGRPGTGIAGVWAREDGEFRFGGAQPAFDVDSLPLPDRTITPGDRDLYFIDWMRPVELIRSSVGCPYRCTFCSVWQIVDGRYYTRELDRVADEMAGLRAEYVFLVDDEAFVNGKRMLALATELRARGVHKRFFAYARADTIVRNRDVLAAWREIGLERLMVGIDAIGHKDLVEYRKGYEVASIENALRTTDELGIEVLAQFVVNTDYQARDFDKLARFVEHHRIRYPSFTVLTPLPGTDLMRGFDSIVERAPNGRPNWDLFDTQNAVTATRLPRDEFRRLYRDLFRQFRGAYGRYLPFHTVADGAATPAHVARPTALTTF